MNISFLGFTIDWLTFFGLGAQFLFFLRFIYQWLASERKKESVIPIQFWYFSIAGGILIIIYAFIRKDLVFFLGQIFALFIYFRNLVLLKKNNISNNSKKYSTLNPIKKLFILLFLKELERLIFSLKIKNILDLGCGEGQIIGYLREKNPTLKFIGMDISEKAIEEAELKNKGVKFLSGDVNKIPDYLLKNNFDLVLVLEVLEHLIDPKKVLKELNKIKANYFLFSVPNEPWFSIGNLLIGKNLNRFGKDRDHRHFWTRKSFFMFIQQDFKLIKSVTNSFWIITLVKKKV